MIIMIISFTKRLLTNQTSQIESLSKTILQLAPSPPSSYQPPDTVDYLCFLYVSSSSVKTPLSSQVGNIVLIDAFNVLSRVLSIVLFLRASCCFPAEKKTRSIPPPRWQIRILALCTQHVEHQRGTDPSVWCVGYTDRIPKSSSESIALTHLCASKMHSTPGQSMTWLCSQHHFLSLEPNSWQKQDKNKTTTNRTPMYPSQWSCQMRRVWNYSS